MTAIFLKLLNMSIAASYLVLAVILLRVLLKKAPRWIACLLWGIVALRLVMPFAFESVFSLIPSPEVIPLDVAVSETPAIYSGIPAVNNAVNPLFTLNLPQGGALLQQILSVAAMVWLVGVGLLLLYSIITYLHLRWQVRVSLPEGKNILVCDDVKSPFVLGVLFPKIYLPSGINDEQKQHVLAHENAHLKRRDHWWKPLGFLLLTVYWFNPLLWVAYILLCRDIEQACDEKVIAGMDPAGKVGYSAALAACSVHRRMVMACPVAFGEISVKARIKQVLHYKKPAFWIILVSVAMCGVIAMCFLTNPIPCDHAYHSENTIASTCIEEGMLTLTCDQCLHSYTTRADLLEHAYDEGVVTLEATCIEHGSQVFSCTGCGLKKTRDLDMTPHTLGEEVTTKEPNCAETGEVCATCTYCKDTFVTQTLETNDVHDLHETVLRKATCAQKGEGQITCSRCDYTESCTYEKLEHNYVKKSEHWVTCEWYGLRTMKCTECGKIYDIELKPRGHDWKATSAGYSVCSRCGMRGSSGNYSLFGEQKEPSESLVIRWDLAHP